MPLLTDEQLHAIRQIIADHHSAFVANHISPEAIPPEVLARLREQGLISTAGNAIEDAYLYGMVVAASQDPAVSGMNLNQFRGYMKSNPMPLSPVERRAIQYAQHQAGQYAVGLGNTFDIVAGQTIITAASAIEQEKMRGQIRDSTAEAIAKRKAMRGLAKDLKWATRDFTRNWDRIATTELHGAHQNGVADDLMGRYGAEVRVAKRPTPDACEHCKRLHLVGGVGPPRVFKLSELQANGTNFKKKAREWQAVVGSVHPNCQCMMIRIPDGWGFDENWDIVPGGDREDYESEADIARAIQEEDQLRKAFRLQGNIDFQGIPIAIENRKGTVRTWKTPEGDTGKTRMEYAYGYAKRTSGDDEDEIDVYVGPDPRSKRVFVVNQLDTATGRHDEAKCFVGFRSEGDAKLAYLSHIDDPAMFGGCLAMDIDAFKRWLGITQPKPGNDLRETRLTVPLQKARIKTPEGGKTPAGYTVKIVNGKRTYVKEKVARRSMSTAQQKAMLTAIAEHPKAFREKLDVIVGEDFDGAIGFRGDTAGRKPGEALPDSRVYEEGESTGEVLGGASAIIIAPDYAYNPDDVIESNLQHHAKDAAIYGEDVYVVVGKPAKGGEDPGEIIIPEARVLISVWDLLAQFQKSIAGELAQPELPATSMLMVMPLQEGPKRYPMVADVLQKKMPGPFVGPKGGLWVDSKHTISWRGETKAPAINVDKLLVGNFGVARIDMPQIRSDLVPEWITSLKAKGIGVTRDKAQVGKLKATQNELHADKIKGMIETPSVRANLAKPIIVSKDGYVLDGHHRWGAMRTLDPKSKIQTVKVALPMAELLKEAERFEGVAHKKSLLDEAEEVLLKGPQRYPVLVKALARRSTPHLPVGGQISTEIGAQTSPAAARAPGAGTFSNFLPGSLERTPVERTGALAYDPNPKTPEDIESRKMRADMDEHVGYAEEVPIDARTVEKPDMQLYIGLEGPFVHPGRDNVPVITTETSQQWHPRDDAGVNERDRIEADIEHYDQATGGDDVDVMRIREERPIAPELGLVLHERTDEDRRREQAERKQLEENERKGRMRPKNKVG